MPAWKRIVCAVDESSGSYAAMRAAARLARDLGAELLLVHVDAKPAGEALFAPPPAARVFTQHSEVQRWLALGSDLRGEAVSVERLTGDAAGEIIAFARRARADLLVVGARARNPLSLALGSIAARVLVHAPCPVLVVSPEGEERERMKSDFPGRIA